MSFLKRGFSEIKRAQEVRMKADRPNRFWIPSGQVQSVGWVDDDMVGVEEHQPNIGGSFRGNQFSCLKGTYDVIECCIRLGADSRRLSTFSTVVQLTPWYDGKGQEHNFEIILNAMPYAVAEKMERRKASRGTLVGFSVECARGTQDKSSSVGDDFEVREQIIWDRLLPKINFRGKRLLEMFTEADKSPEAKERLKLLFPLEFDTQGRIIRKVYPFNYAEVLKPPSPEEVKDLLLSYSPSASRPNARPQRDEPYTTPRDEGPSFGQRPAYAGNTTSGRSQAAPTQRQPAPAPRNGGPREPVPPPADENYEPDM